MSLKYEPYLTVELKKYDGSLLPATELLSEMKVQPKILVHGRSGTGKTALMNQLISEYCQYTNLWQAWKKYKMIPVLMPLRELPGQTVTETTKAAFQKLGFSFSDNFFLEKLIERSEFLLILDGLNEVDLNKEIVHFSSIQPKIKMLMTSQEKIIEKNIKNYHLPDFDEENAISLIKLIVGQEKGIQIVNKIGPTIKELTSGYDIKMVADQMASIIVSTQPLKRIDIYERTMSNALQGEPNYPRYVIDKIAYEKWKAGHRLFSCNEELTESLIWPLLKTPASVLVRRGDRKFEFRHDLLRAYLSACWLVRPGIPISTSVDCLKDESIWLLQPEEQISVFEFMVLKITDYEDFKIIASFAMQEPVKRSYLLEAVKGALKTKDMDLNTLFN